MKLNTFLSTFAPKEVKFNSLLIELSGIVDKSADYMQELFTTDNTEQIKELCRLIKLEETKGDEVTGKIFSALNVTFLTPFDREDLSELTDNIDDVVDSINRGARKVLLYSPEIEAPAMLEMAKVIKRGTSEIHAAISDLPNLKKSYNEIGNHTREIKTIEEEADRIYEKGISTLFHSNVKTQELIKIKEILLDMEKAANKINNVGKILKTIVVKYS
ncbi:MAG: DUF47 family protein [Tannerella sp.]|jgi:predicted phosphate transport protein (TIGR00153 family)|nr:DUF47 family protein [Tannerella sp.]